MPSPCAPDRDQAGDRPVAVFDLDGTLVARDTFLPFLCRYAVQRRRWHALLALPLVVVLYLLRLISDRTAKEQLLVRAFRGEPRQTIVAEAERFAQHWVLPRLRPHTLAELRRHQQAGHRVILLSASPDLYVDAIARLLHIPEVVATRVRFAGPTCDGTIVGANCKGPEKVRALQAHLGQLSPPPGSFAYGDATSDLPVLRWVQHGFLVGRRGLRPVP